MRNYVMICHCYEDMGMLPEAKHALQRASSKIVKLRAEEELDTPLPLAVENILHASEKDVQMLSFKYALMEAKFEEDTSDAEKSNEQVKELLAEFVGVSPKYHALAVVEAFADFNQRHMHKGKGQSKSEAGYQKVSERCERALRKTKYIRATNKITLILNFLVRSPPPCSIKNAPRFARRRFS